MEDKRALARARDLAYRCLALRDRSRAELAAYLKKKEVPDELAGSVLGEFEAHGYIDDRRFAEKYARYLIGKKGLSRYMLKAELVRMGVSKADADAGLSLLFDDDGEGGEDDLTTALKAARKKAATLGRVEPEKARRRLTDYLRRRGFSYEVISRAVKAALTSD